MRRLRFAVLAFFCLALPSVVPGQELDGPAEGKARVYVFQIPPPPNPARDPYPVFTAQLFDGHSYVGFVGPSQYYGFDIDPGTHVLWAKTIPTDRWQGAQKWFLRAKVKAGRTYYVHLLVTYGMARPTLISAGPTTTRGEKTLKKINKRLAKHPFDVPRRRPGTGTLSVRHTATLASEHTSVPSQKFAT